MVRGAVRDGCRGEERTMASGRSRGERGAVRIDPRLLIGVLLVASSTAGVWFLVSGLDDAREVYVARDTLTPGTRIDEGDLATESVRLGASAAHYLAPGDLGDDGLVVVRTVRAGELVPAAAIDDSDSTGLASVVVPSRGPLPADVDRGSMVDVWTASERERGVFDPPAVLVPGAEVAGVIASDGMVASEGVSVELLVPREKVAALLQALSAGDAIDLVPARTAGGQ
ncbi:hypothetical protein EDM22_13760 [Agromyces tardus]|uniref:SAF domain-containing protein n=2 Tax=Agromyces tardus TaxID=2583849 RepID=A0A3M8A5Z7_9MICO|nr:hypothetical protein EDM22_13760 [Agromyces tardus]